MRDKMKQIIFLAALFALVACEKKNDVEVVKNYDLEYLSPDNVAAQATPTDVEKAKKNIEVISKRILSEVNSLDDKNLNFILLNYRFYINDKGKVDKIALKSFGNNLLSNFIISKNISPETLAIIENEVVKFAKETEFTPASQNNKPVKSQYDLLNSGLINRDYYDGYVEGTNKAKTDGIPATDEVPYPIGGVEGIMKNIKYPELAKRAGIEGRVFVKAFVDEKGNVYKTEIIKSAHNVLDSAAANAVLKTKFIPAKKNGVAIKTEVAVPIAFRLK